ncbi:hypothetical protein SUDANB95_01578 [Actinosynnema sp. ALI-1.44]
MFAKDDHGVELNARFTVEAEGDRLSLVLASAGGRTSDGRSRNSDYVPALRLLLARLRTRRAVLEAALVDSDRVKGLPEHERALLAAPVPLAEVQDLDRLRLDITTAQGRVAMPAGAAKEGNNRKRLRLRLTVPGYGPQDADRLAADLADPTTASPTPETPAASSSASATATLITAPPAGARAASGSGAARDETARPRHWVLQCNPAVWDVWSWWQEGATGLKHWTVAKHHQDIRTGDRFAFWVSGKGAGMYATGTVLSEPYETSDFDGHWRTPPTGAAHVVDLRFDRYLFDKPVLRRSLARRPEFAGSLIIRMPGYGNPVPLTADQWRVLSAAAERSGRSDRPRAGETVITSRPLGSVPAETETRVPAQQKRVSFAEAQLVQAYHEFLGRELRCLSARLPSGELLVCDAFDPDERLIIEAKASNGRFDVRLAIGQLLDYRHHIDRDAGMAVLLPDEPSASVADLLRSQGIKLIFRSGGTFVGPR